MQVRSMFFWFADAVMRAVRGGVSWCLWRRPKWLRSQEDSLKPREKCSDDDAAIKTGSCRLPVAADHGDFIWRSAKLGRQWCFCKVGADVTNVVVWLIWQSFDITSLLITKQCKIFKQAFSISPWHSDSIFPAFMAVSQYYVVMKSFYRFSTSIDV